MNARKAGLLLLLPGVVCVAGLITLGQWAGGGERWHSTEVLRGDRARHPTLVPFDGRIALFWTDGYPTPASTAYGPLPPAADDRTIEIHWADLGARGGRRLKRDGAIVVPLVHASWARNRPALCRDRRGVLLVHPRHMWESRAGMDAVVQRIESLPASGRAHTALLANPPLTVLPHSLPGSRVRRMPPPDSTLAKWFIYHTQREMDFRRMDLCRDPEGKGYFLCGEDHISGAIWVTRSDDGKAWADPTVLAHDVCYPAIDARAGKVVVTWTAAGKYSYQNLWPDDWPPSPAREPFSPRSGSLKYRLSNDRGKTWAEPMEIRAATHAISSRCVWGPDGSLCVVYVKWLGDTMTTALYLVRSPDGGRTWTEPQQITSGEWVDRDVDIALADKELIVAFSRCRRPGTPSSLWIWQEPIEATM